DLEVVSLPAAEAERALRRGRIALLVRANVGGASTLIADPTRPETRLAQLATTEALERAAGRADLVRPQVQAVVRPGSRYVDFLVPGLVGLNLLGTSTWRIGFAIA